jgi:hypothetical protein
MISITLALAAILVAWAGTTYGLFSSSSQLYFAQRGQALQERFVVENVFFNRTGTNHTIMIFVRNVGVEDISLVAIYINATSYVPQKIWLCTGSLPVRIGVGYLCEFNINWPSAWSPGSVFNIVVTSARGNRATYSVRGP